MRKRVSVKGKGADLFFGDAAPEPAEAAANGHQPPAPPDPEAPAQDPPLAGSLRSTASPPPRAPKPSRRPARQLAPDQASDPASALASIPASDLAAIDGAVIESIRKTVKVPGKEVSFVRLTPAEKTRLGDIVYTYKRQGLKTTETEINRIAVNYLLADFQEHGEQSVRAKVLAALRA